MSLSACSAVRATQSTGVDSTNFYYPSATMTTILESNRGRENMTNLWNLWTACVTATLVELDQVFDGIQSNSGYPTLTVEPPRPSKVQFSSDTGG